MNTALVCQKDAGDPGARGGVHQGHPRADFIAQLIATSTQAPQTRTRRRAEPDEAVAAYRALGQRPTPTGQSVTRSL